MKKRESFDLRENDKSESKSEDSIAEAKGLKGDYLNIGLLLVLYFLQGIPLGIQDVIPLILVNKKVSYDKQAIFSLSSWPFSIKLLWAPIVDSIYSTRFGRRKSWFVPVQYGIGGGLMIIAFVSEHLIGNMDNEKLHSSSINLLTVAFFFLVFLTATQDVAVDGWALTLLSKRNVHYAPSCNSVGQTVGSLFGSTVFLALESKDFCNRWLRSVPLDEGMVTFKGYLLFWGIVFLAATTCVWIFKHESDHIAESGETELGFIGTYKMLWKILCLPSIRWFAVILLTNKIGVAAADAVTPLKVVEYGVKRENIGILKLPLIPLQLLLPWVITKFTTKRPLTSFLYMYPFRLSVGFVGALMVWWTNVSMQENGTFDSTFYTSLVIGFAVAMVSSYATGMAIWSFMAQVSDPLIGGTYMTLLTTLSNMGGSWTNTVALYFVKILTFRWCPNDEYFCSASDSKSVALLNLTITPTNYTNSSNSTITVKPEDAHPIVDGFYIEIAISFVLGVAWMALIFKKIKWLQSQPKSSWRCK